MPQLIASALAIFVLMFQSLASASPLPRGSIFPATEEDGTPHVIHVKKTRVSQEEERVIESDHADEYLESLAGTAAINKAKPESTDSLAALKVEVEGLKAQLQGMQATPQKNPDIAVKKMRTAGERVPPEHRREMARRISAASQILKKYGIAYDYRTMTVKDFMRVEALLSKATEQKNQEESAPSEALSDN